MIDEERSELRADGGTDREPWRVGSSTRVITPEKSMWMAGYGAREEPSEGAAMDLHAKAVAIEGDDGETVVLVGAEILGYTPDLRAAVVDACESDYDVDGENVVLNATHTHHGPEYRTDDYGILGLDEELDQRARDYRKRLERELIAVIGEALQDRSSAALRYSHAQCGMAMSRRRPQPDRIDFSLYPDGAADHDVPVLVATSGGEVTALMFGYACHPTSLPRTLEFHGEWPGLAMERLEEAYPEATAMFVQGCGGDTKAYPQDDPEFTEIHAETLATAVQAAVKARGTTVHGPLRTTMTEATLKFEDQPNREELEARVEDGGDRYAQRLLDELDWEGEIRTEFPYPVQAIGFGDDFTMVALAGEVLVDYSLDIKDALEGDVWVAGYSNHGYVYVPNRRHLHEGGYEASWVYLYWDFPAPLKPSVEETVTETALSLAERVGARRADVGPD